MVIRVGVLILEWLGQSPMELVEPMECHSDRCSDKGAERREDVSDHWATSTVWELYASGCVYPTTVIDTAIVSTGQRVLRAMFQRQPRCSRECGRWSCTTIARVGGPFMDHWRLCGRGGVGCDLR